MKKENRKVRPVRPVRPKRISSNTVTLFDQRTTPLREWDRATQFLSVFAISGFISEKTPQGAVVACRPASVLLVGHPGSGKTELIERFRMCRWLSYHNDLTARPLLQLFNKASEQIITHVAAPEFNKWFQRKGFVVENCLGLLSEGMEEGLRNYDVGPTHLKWEPPARLGFFGGMTPATLDRKRFMLAEMGWLSRACVIEWQLPRSERDEIQRRINLGIADDLSVVHLPRPEEVGDRVTVQWNEQVGDEIIRYVRERWPEQDMRVFKRFKTILLARAFLTQRKKVTDSELDWLKAHDDYWGRMILGEG